MKPGKRRTRGGRDRGRCSQGGLLEGGVRGRLQGRRGPLDRAGLFNGHRELSARSAVIMSGLCQRDGLGAHCTVTAGPAPAGPVLLLRKHRVVFQRQRNKTAHSVRAGGNAASHAQRRRFSPCPPPHTHARMSTHNPHTGIHARVHMNTYAHMRTRVHTYTCVRTSTHMCTRVCTHIYIHAHARARTFTHPYMHVHVHTHAHVHAHTHTER